MSRTQRFNKDEDFDEKGLLKDGKTYRAGPVTMMDHRTDDTGPMRITTDSGRDGNYLRKPGFRCLLEDDAGQHAKQRAYADYDRRLRDSYKDDDLITGAGERGARGAKAGDLCTINGRAGHLKMVNSQLQCIPDARTDAAPGDERICPECDGSGRDDNGDVRDTCGGNGMVDDDYEENAEDIVRNAATHSESARRRDHHTVAQMMGDHQNKMADIYDKLDHELSETWRRS